MTKPRLSFRKKLPEFPKPSAFLTSPKFEFDSEKWSEAIQNETPILQTIFDNMADGIVVADLTGRLIVYNRALEQMLGMGSLDIPYEQWSLKYGLYLPDQKTLYPVDQLPLMRALLGEDVRESVEVFVKNSKRPKGCWISVNAHPIRNAEGKVLGAVAVSRDITAQKKYSSESAQTEEALQASESRFKSLVSNIPGAIYRCAMDASWTMEFLSDAIEEMTGYPASDFVQNRVRSFASIIHPDDAASVEQSVLKSVRRKRSYSLEYRILHKDGQVRWVYERGRASFGKEGAVLWLDGAIFDITDQRQAEQQVQQSSDYLEKIMNSIADPIFVKDRQHRWALLNDACCRFIGRSREVLIGKSDYEFFPKAEADIFWEKDEAVFNTGNVNLNEESFTDSKGVRHVIVTKKTLYQDANGEKWIVGVIRDITEQKHIAERLSAQYAVTRAMAEAASLEEAAPRILQGLCESLDWDLGVFWKLDRPAQVLRCVEIWNKPGMEKPQFESMTRRFEFRPGIGLPGRIWKSRQPVWIKDVVTDSNFPRFASAGEEGIHAAFGFLIEIAGEITGAVEFFSHEMRSPDPQLLKMVESLSVQIAQFVERKQAQETLVQKSVELARLNAEREYLELFAYVASHDLQEPLQKVIAFGSLLKSTAQGLDEKSRSCVERMEQASLRMSRMIEDLLRFTKVTTGSDLFEAVELKDVLEEVLSDLDFKISKAGAEITVQNLPVLHADRRQMYQLFLNLITNALKFQAPGVSPRIVVTSRPSAREGFSEIGVKDNGIGFDEKNLERIFRPFERIHPREKYDGSGIGLAICKKIVARHGGAVTAKSREGKGTTFWVTLPSESKRGTSL
jgi:PAS domain S-box-containing protein